LTVQNKYIEPSIVPFIESQFDVLYRENSPLFVQFLTSYYSWMEQEGGITNLSRGFLDLRDVDRTTQDFLVLLKQKYVNGLRLDTVSDTRQLVKHAKDLYRAKGTIRALDLFFRLLYDEVISVYYPKDDLLIPSDGTWVKPRYLELSLSLNNVLLEGKAIIGLTSGATAFVDSVTRRILGDRLADSAYISSIEGMFRTGEIIVPVDGFLSIEECPSIVGSLNNLIFDSSGSGSGYSVGDVFPINSPYGVLGLARVAEVVEQSGLINLNLNDGGYGYSNTATVYVSDSVINVSNVVVSNTYARDYFRAFSVISQPLAQYNFRNGTGTFSPGDTIRAWSNSTTISGNGTVLSTSYTNSTAGQLFVYTDSGSLNANQVLNVGNTKSANLSVLDGGYGDKTATGFVVGTANLVLFTDASAPFVAGETVIQRNVNFPTDGSIQGQGVVTVSGNSFVSLINHYGVFRAGPITGLISAAGANVVSVQVTAGIKLLNNSFVTLPGNKLTSPGVSGISTFQGSLITATFGISPALTHTEQVRICTDSLSTIANAPLAGPYGLAANATANVTTDLSTCLTFANVVIGSLSNVYTITTGTQFDAPPVVMVAENRTITNESFDLTIKFQGATTAFGVGEVLTQSATNARALVKTTNSSSLEVTNLRLNPNNGFVITSPSG